MPCSRPSFQGQGWGALVEVEGDVHQEDQDRREEQRQREHQQRDDQLTTGVLAGWACRPLRRRRAPRRYRVRRCRRRVLMPPRPPERPPPDRGGPFRRRPRLLRRAISTQRFYARSEPTTPPAAHGIRPRAATRGVRWHPPSPVTELSLQRVEGLVAGKDLGDAELGWRPSAMAARNSRSCSSMPFIETATCETSIFSSLPVTRSSYRAM